jgi:glycosyltransferase involved in cell wall biosynthesis
MGFRNYKLKNALNQAAQLIAPTDFVRQTYRQLGVEPANIQVIPHGIRPPDTKPVPGTKTAAPLRVTYIGGLAPQKGIHILIQAVNQLPPDLVSLNIYGDLTAFPDYISGLKNQIQHPAIEFKGLLPHESLWNALAESDVVVVPSLWYETASLIIQEAFAAGVPVLASNIGALKERVRDGLDGRLFPPGDAAALSNILAELAQNPQNLSVLAAQIQPVFTIDQHQTAVQQCYQLALAESSAV